MDFTYIRAVVLQSVMLRHRNKTGTYADLPRGVINPHHMFDVWHMWRIDTRESADFQKQ